MFKLTKKKVAVGIVAAGMVAMTGVGYAYWTSTGSGTGSASTGTAANNLVVHGTTSPALTPGTSGTVSFTADNPSGFAQSISKIKLDSVAAYDTAANAAAGGATGLIAGCGGANSGAASTTTGSDFWMTDVTVPPGGDGHIAANAVGQVLTTTGTLHMNDLLGQDQEACKSVALRLNFSSI